MELPGADIPSAAVEFFSDAILPRGKSQHGRQDHGGRDWCSFEVGDLAAVAACRERFGGAAQAFLRELGAPAARVELEAKGLEP